MDISTLVPPLADTQEAYEKIFRWFSRPNVEFGYDEGSCVYRGEDNYANSNIRCAIGCLMPDQLYEEGIDSGDLYEGMAGFEAITSTENLRRYFENVSPEFLNAAQNCHDKEAMDTNPLPERFLLELNKVAAQYNLRLIAS